VIVEAHITEDGSVRQNLPGKLSTTSTIVAVVLLATVGAFGATGKEARDFVDEAEARLLDLWIEAGRASWVKANFITQDTEALEAAAMEKLMAATADIAADSTRFDGLELPADLRRKILLIKTSLPTVAPRDPDKQAEQARITSAMEGVYGKGKYCSEARDGECLDLTAMTRILAESRDAGELLDLWVGWRTISPPMREMYERFVELNNEGAKELGFADLGELWRSGYDMSPAAFAGEVDRLWGQVKPLYDALHCHVRARLAETYGSEVVPGDAPIPAHLLGNMWSQSWGNVYDLVGRRGTASGSSPHWASSRCRKRSGSARCSPSPPTARSYATPVRGISTTSTTCGSRCASTSRRKISRRSTTSWVTTSTSAPTPVNRLCTETAPTTDSTRASATRWPCRSRPSTW
jgi:hypothetical protein